jgi:hypothetical protein
MWLSAPKSLCLIREAFEQQGYKSNYTVLEIEINTYKIIIFLEVVLIAFYWMNLSNFFKKNKRQKHKVYYVFFVQWIVIQNFVFLIQI